MSRKRGRPPGAKTIKELVEVKASRCTRCGSTRRTDYHNTYYRDYSGHGLPFIGIHYRACSCEDCGRPRRDLEKVYPPADENNNRNAIIEPDPSVDRA
jgi:hypothetical protein